MSKMVLKGLLCTLLALHIWHVAALDLSQSNWITFGPRDVDNGVTHDFRFYAVTPVERTAVSAQILISCDDDCLIWLNGVSIGHQAGFKTSSNFCVQLSLSTNIFAVRVQNEGISGPNASAFLAAIQINYTGGGPTNSSNIFVTDTAWRANNFTPGFEQYGFLDSPWGYANIVGAANDPPWNLPAPPTNSHCN